MVIAREVVSSACGRVAVLLQANNASNRAAPPVNTTDVDVVNLPRAIAAALITSSFSAL